MWGFRPPDGRKFRWYEMAWAGLPLVLAIVGGGIGGLVGAGAAAINLKLMASRMGVARRFLFSSLVSIAAMAAYIVAAKLAINLLYPPSDRIDRELAATPLYQAIKQADPQTYAAIRATFRDGYAQGKSKLEMETAVRGKIGAVLNRSLPKSSDAAVIKFTRLVTLELDQLGSRNADACYAYLYPGAGGTTVDFGAYISAEVVKFEQEANLEVIQTASVAPQPVPAKDDVNGKLQQVGRQLVEEFGADDVAALSTPARLDHAKVCSITSALYKHVLELPIKDAGAVLRFLYAQVPAA